MIFVIMGKSATGKDTVLSKMLERKDELGLEEVIPYTTRPIRNGERDGKDYFFVTEKQMEAWKASGRIVESRVYHTIHGDWHYFTLDDARLRDVGRRCLLINTLEAYENMLEFYGESMVVPIYLEVDDFIRLERAIKREKEQNNPSCLEVCRRYMSDEEDFSENRLRNMNIIKRYNSIDLDLCCQDIANEIKNML